MSTLYGRGHDRAQLLIGIYVDDLVITGSDHDEITRFKEEMKKEFLMSDLGLLSFYLGIEVHQGRDGITLNQGNYAAHILDIAGLRNCNPTPTPMEERLKLSRESTAHEIDATTYRRIIGSLRYLIHTRPDLAFLVGYVSRFMERHTVEHMDAVKRLLRCIAGTIDYGLSYPRGSQDDTRKSTS